MEQLRLRLNGRASGLVDRILRPSHAFRAARLAPSARPRSRSQQACSAVLEGSRLAAHPPSEAALGSPAAATLAQRLPACLLGVAALALVQPAAFSWFHPAVNGQHALTCVMLATGLTLSLEDVKRVLRSPGCVLDGLALQYAVLPSVALLLVHLLGLPPEYAVGLLLVSCCPGGSASAVVSHLAGADVPLNVMMTAAGVLCASVATPLLSSLLLGVSIPVNGAAMALSTLQVVLLPVLAGVAIREVFPAAVAPLRPLCTLTGAALLALSLGSYVAHTSTFVAATGAAAALRAAWPRLLAAVTALHTAGFVLGYALSRAMGLPEAVARSHAIQTGQRNSVLASQLACASFPAHPLAAVPCAVSACVHTALGGLAAAYWAERPASGAAAGELSSSSGGSPSSSSGSPGSSSAYPAGLLSSLLLTSSTEAAEAAKAAAAHARSAVSSLQSSLQSSAAAIMGRLRKQTEAQLQVLREQGVDLQTAVAEPGASQQQQQGQQQSRQQRRPANPHAMNVVMVGAECAPWSKTGGLGDVMQALPKALAARGHRVMVVAPRYKDYTDVEDSGLNLQLRVFNEQQEVKFYILQRDGVDYVFINHPAYRQWADEIYGGTRHEVLFRCALLTKAALEAPCVVPCGGGGQPYGDSNLVFIANDWHTALLPVYLQAHYRDWGRMQFARSVLVLHNMAHQGRGPVEDLGLLEVPEDYAPLFWNKDERQQQHMNVMKAGAITSHRIVAVSNKYAEECQTPLGGWGLDAVLRSQAWKLRGVVNGIDCMEWSPVTDTFLKSDGYTNYSVQTLREGKARCKAALQRELGLPVDPKAPLLGFIGRLDFQKGVDLIAENYEWLMQEGAQLVLLGSGREDLEAALREMEARNPRQCKAWVGFSIKMAHRITAGVDLLLMPSRFEPCGLNQLYAMAYGTPPVVHAVGGLHDTVEPFDPFENTGRGWAFYDADPAGFRRAMSNAITTWRDYPDSFRGVQLRGMEQDLSWDNAAAQYEAVLLGAKYQW
ncbi:hypothetical protein ABPG75_002934 [Micractinium tetrahymenae]